MRNLKLIRSAVGLGLILATAFSTDALEPSNKGQGHAHKGYFKPGAAVSLHYDYDEKTLPGEIETINFTLEHHYSSGYLSARFIETNSLNIISDNTLENHDLATTPHLSLPVQISGTIEGEHFISLEITYESLVGNRSLRVVSLPIYIGDKATSKNGNTLSQKSNTGDGKGLVILSAHEVIK